MDSQKGRPGAGQQQRRENYTAFDRAMIAASQSDTPIYFTMAEGSIFTGMIKSVDKYFIELTQTGKTGAVGTVWISKAMILSAQKVAQ